MGRPGRGVVEVGDRSCEDWAAALHAAVGDCDVVVLTGDDPAATTAFRQNEGVDEVLADVRPQAKAAIVRQLGARGTVAMVGDGTNDAPALAAADLGSAAFAADAADVGRSP